MESLPSVIGPYRVIRKLGEGGMGAVFEAVHEVIQRRVAIKVLHPEAGRSAEAINRFINEARAANLIGHPGLVQITDFGNLPDGTGYLVMEYLKGQTLSERLDGSGGALSSSEAVQIGLEMASALSSAHKAGIVHRDLKPSNVMLVPDPAMPTGERLKLLDFGLAKLTAVREAAMVKTNSLAVLGTPLYMSPEQCRAADQVDEKSDVYSLGCMLYEMLSGRTPFTGEGPGEIIGQHLFKEPVPLGTLAPSAPAPLATLVDRLLLKSKEERPSMREVQKELEAMAALLPPPPRREEAESAAAPDALPDASPDASKVRALGVASTLGEGAAEIKKSAAPRPRTGIFVAGALFLLGGSAVMLIVTLKLGALSRRPPATVTAPAVVAPAAPPPQAERTIHWSITTTPPGAALVDAQGVQLGETPWSLGRQAESGTQSVRLHKAGYADKLLILKLDADEERNETLESLPRSRSRKEPTGSTAPTRSRATSQPKKGLYKSIMERLHGSPSRNDSAGSPAPSKR